MWDVGIDFLQRRPNTHKLHRSAIPFEGGTRQTPRIAPAPYAQICGSAFPGSTRLHCHPGHNGDDNKRKDRPGAAEIEPHFEPGALVAAIGIRADAAVDAHGLAAFGACFGMISRGGHGGTSLVLRGGR